jgi:hypothetical protein
LYFRDVTEEDTYPTSATKGVPSSEAAGDLFSDEDSDFDKDMHQMSMGGDNPIQVDNKLLVSVVFGEQSNAIFIASCYQLRQNYVILSFWINEWREIATLTGQNLFQCFWPV